MKKIILLPAALLLATLTIPTQGQTNGAGMAQQPDSVAVDSIYDEAIDSAWVGNEEEEWAADPVWSGSLCPLDEELPAEFNAKQADYSYHNKGAGDGGVSFSAQIYVPSEDVDKKGYAPMLSNILRATLPDDAQATWQEQGIENMIEAKWKAVKQNYIAETEGETFLPSFAYLTTLTPAWRFADKGNLITYKINDDVYTGGAHGMSYTYYLTLNTQTGNLCGLSDLISPRIQPAVLNLVGQKLTALLAAEGYNSPFDAALNESPYPRHPLLLAHALEELGGHWYPRPALTPCGILFSYAPYEKAAYALGTLEILITYEELEQLGE